MPTITDFLTENGLIDGNKVTPATASSNGVVNTGEGLRINSAGELSLNTAAVVSEVIANMEIPEISNADINAIFN